MARDLNAKCKQCRREGVKLFIKGERCNSSKCAMVKRNYIPGIHGIKLGRGGRLTGYGIQLREKQKAKRMYRILEKQFRNYFDKAIHKTGETGDNLFNLLETRLDNVIYKAGFGNSRDAARQLISHYHFLVNGKKVNIPSFQVKVKDKITVKPKSQKMQEFIALPEKLKNFEAPEWLSIDAKEMQITMIDEPNLEKSTPGFDLKLIIEFYSK
ncbi:30S ribosomal protein S4 [Candidatus Falkowbacteria bacterium]|jgi:small subunit ribosomal protein S4|nr:30S ribosomal protein S4 [Candidatus Falkowbacteria bacterium]MBT5502881.1 30S ribosomal protein S4 [Candidatus Falkowbacteria bacterium]MBT6573755.1 30S ribosomal protein S4 [Candidatus Falkowbacteria bacterium]MBT7349131.1 30S ribosomal protein S4 [Candidatus Falkowbacteria bacterium]MBT7500083.1 30S ribosomal protein S4 [Candidatus Falkowbacteria bacterium]